MAVVHLNGFGTNIVAGDYIATGNNGAGTSTFSRQAGRNSGFVLRHSNSASTTSYQNAGHLIFPAGLGAAQFSIGWSLNHRAAWTPANSSSACAVGFSIANGSQSSYLAASFGTGTSNVYDRSFYSPWTVSDSSITGVGWHWWNAVWKYGSSDGYLKIYRDGTLLATAGPDLTWSAVGFIRAYLGNANGGAQCDLGDLIVRNDVTLIPSQQVITLFPTATTAAAWLGSDGNSVNNEALVNENPDHNAATYVGSPTVGAVDTYTVADLPGTATSVLAVQVGAKAVKSDAGAKTMQVLANANTGTAIDPGGGTTVYGVFELNAGAAWTTATVNSVTAGIKVVS